MSDRLYAWADTTHIRFGEHTWVTTYAPGTGNPDPDKGHYWYCWGDPHVRSRALGVGTGGSEFARMIARPHDPKADVGLRYWYDGLCHQMANRLLRFTFDDNGNPLTVKDAKGISFPLECMASTAVSSIPIASRDGRILCQNMRVAENEPATRVSFTIA